MENIFTYLFLVFLLLLFFYFGYRDDYKRNPKQFLKIIIGVPLGFVAATLNALGISNKIKDWIRKEDD